MCGALPMKRNERDFVEKALVRPKAAAGLRRLS